MFSSIEDEVFSYVLTYCLLCHVYTAKCFVLRLNREVTILKEAVNFIKLLPFISLKGYSGVSLIHVITHLDTEYNPPSRDKVCEPLAYVVLASSEMTAQQ